MGDDIRDLTPEPLGHPLLGLLRDGQLEGPGLGIPCDQQLDARVSPRWTRSPEWEPHSWSPWGRGPQLQTSPFHSVSLPGVSFRSVFSLPRLALRLISVGA